MTCHTTIRRWFYRIAGATLLLAVSASQLPAEDLGLCARCPEATILSLDRPGTSRARIVARIERATLRDYCGYMNANASLEDCANDLRKTFGGLRMTVSANCSSGALTWVTGTTYQRAGAWRRGEVDLPSLVGLPKFKGPDGSIEPTANAYYGIALAHAYDLLCPASASGRRGERRRTPSNALGDSGHPTAGLFDHNGSLMTIDIARGTIVYKQPRSGLARLVQPGTVLFRGTIVENGPVLGTAFVFRRGCRPAGYPVTGHFHGTVLNGSLVVEGAAPVRPKGSCRVTGYSSRSGNASLVFDTPTGSDLERGLG